MFSEMHILIMKNVIKSICVRVRVCVIKKNMLMESNAKGIIFFHAVLQKGQMA
jgi:hypothetical protein